MTAQDPLPDALVARVVPGKRFMASCGALVAVSEWASHQAGCDVCGESRI